MPQARLTGVVLARKAKAAQGPALAADVAEDVIAAVERDYASAGVLSQAHPARHSRLCHHRRTQQCAGRLALLHSII